MAKIISCSINLSKIDKTKIVLAKDGITKYLNIQVSVNDNKDQYGHDSAIWIQQSKEERENKEKKTYIGNGEVVYDSESASKIPSVPQTPAANDDLPF